jgi:hypothetical protein
MGTEDISGLFQSIRRRGSDLMPERRRHPRIDCLNDMKYMARDRWHRGTIRNISEGGAYIHTGGGVYRGAEILLDLPSPISRGQVQAVIVRIDFRGIGVEFREPEVKNRELGCFDHEDVPVKIYSFRKECQKMGKVRRRKVRWEPSAGVGVAKYRLYWSRDGGVGYDSDSVEVGNVTQVILPDDVPSFPLMVGQFELGISAISEAGNESDLVKTSVFLDFSIPEAPKNLKIEDL